MEKEDQCICMSLIRTSSEVQVLWELRHLLVQDLPLLNDTITCFGIVTNLLLMTR